MLAVKAPLVAVHAVVLAPLVVVVAAAVETAVKEDAPVTAVKMMQW